MKFSLLASVAVLLGFGVAHAQSAPAMDSEYFHQAPGGVFEIRPHLSYLSITTKPTGGGNDTTSSGITDLGSRFEFGLNEMISLYGDLSFSSYQSKTGNNSSTLSGLDDIELGARGTSAMGMGSLRYGLAAMVSTAKSKTDNVSSGGMSFMPYVGYDMTAGPGFWGARLSYNIRLERTADLGAGDVKYRGANVLGLGTFYEYLLSDMIIGGSLQYDMTSDTKTTAVNGTESSGENSPLLTLALYTRIPAGPGVVLAGLDYLMLTGKRVASSTDNVDSLSGFRLNAGYRIAF